MSIEVMGQALAALETCRIRSVSEWEVSDVTPKNVTAAINALRAALSQQPATRLPEDVVIGHVTLCKGSNISLLIEYAKRLNADVERLEAQQPATGEPVGYMNEGHIHELAMRRLPYGYVYPEAGAGASTAVYAHPAPSVLKDDQIAALVNKVRDIARMFHDHQSLRERIAIELVPALKASQEVKSNAERWRYAIADSGNQTMNFIDIFDDWNGDGDFVEVFDAARLADKP